MRNKAESFEPHEVVAADETAVWSDTGLKKILGIKSSQVIPVLKSFSSKTNFTVMCVIRKNGMSLLRKEFIKYYDDLNWEQGIKKFPVFETPGVVQIRKWVMEAWDLKVTTDLINSTRNTCYFEDDLKNLTLAKVKRVQQALE